MSTRHRCSPLWLDDGTLKRARARFRSTPKRNCHRDGEPARQTNRTKDGRTRWPSLSNLRRADDGARSRPQQKERPKCSRNCDAQTSELRGGFRTLDRNVHKHRGEQQHQQQDDDRAEQAMAATAFDHVTKPDHEGGTLHELPAK